MEDVGESANAKSLVCVQIEDAEAVPQVDAILTVPGVDVFFIGPSDLSQSMGYPGDPKAAPVAQAIEETLAKIRAAGHAPGMPAATEALTKEGFQVMVYCSDDPVICKRLEDAGAVAIMPLGAPIGSGLGIQNPVNIRLIVEQASVPVLVDAGVGTASDAAIAMELGCDGVLMNTAIAEAKDPILMARAMKHAVEAGRLAYLAGRMPRKMYADPSSPLAGLI